jgi:hypothetical protein
MTRQYDAGTETIEANRNKRMSRLPQVDMLDPSVLVSTPDRTLTGPRATHHAASRWPHKPNPPAPRVRLLMPLADASALADVLSSHEGDPGEQRILDQLWLRTVLIEQQRRVRHVERADFGARADRLLEALDPGLQDVTSHQT